MNLLERRIERVEDKHRELRDAANNYAKPPPLQYDETRLLRAARAYAAALRTLAKGTRP